MITIKKRFGPYPAAHRQHNHKGHCAFIHGHNWHFELVFGSDRLDENGFVLDFGKMAPIKSFLADYFDHTLLINKDDPHKDFIFKTIGGLETATSPCLSDIREILDGSAEGLAAFVFNHVQSAILPQVYSEAVKERGLYLVSVTVYEDEKNSSTFMP